MISLKLMLERRNKLVREVSLFVICMLEFAPFPPQKNYCPSMARLNGLDGGMGGTQRDPKMHITYYISTVVEVVLTERLELLSFVTI